MGRTLDALLPYYGCKRQIADVVIKQLGKHQVYFEPFCGSCSVTLAKSPCRMEVVNDLYGAVINLARTIQDDVEAVILYDRLSRTLFCEQLYRDSLDWLNSMKPEMLADRPSEWAYHYFLTSWMGRNGLAGTVSERRTGFCKRYTSGGGDPATRFRNVVANLPRWWERMRNWTILSEDGVALCNRMEDKDGVACYIDCPYLDKQAEYVVDFTYDDHEKLAIALRRFKKTRVVVSYYDHPRLENLYLKYGFNMLKVNVNKNLAIQGGHKKAPEVILVNGEVYG